MADITFAELRDQRNYRQSEPSIRGNTPMSDGGLNVFVVLHDAKIMSTFSITALRS
jgi:hypothetical protein